LTYALNRQVSDTDPANGVVSYTYNALDQLLTVKDARNNTTTYIPNAFGETVQEQSPDTGLTTKTYTNGRLTTLTDARNITHSYTYDAAGRIKTRLDGTASTSYSYDNARNVGCRLVLRNEAQHITPFTCYAFLFYGWNPYPIGS
jgi:YD repeat-containing protein